LLAHFSQAADDEERLGEKNDTRAMVFCSFRECVGEVVVGHFIRVISLVESKDQMLTEQDMLNEHKGILSATKFVGQSQGKQESDKGFNQKEQKQASCEQ
jgi:ATP-dependent DNA helicase MPH1